MKPSCPPSILADEGVGIGPCGWERGTGGRLQGRSRRERFHCIGRDQALPGEPRNCIQKPRPDSHSTPWHTVARPGLSARCGRNTTQSALEPKQQQRSTEEDVWPQHSYYTHGILHGRRSSSAQCGNSCKSGSSRVLSERGGRRKILFRWRGSQEDTLRKPTSFLTWTSAR